MVWRSITNVSPMWKLTSSLFLWQSCLDVWRGDRDAQVSQLPMPESSAQSSLHCQRKMWLTSSLPCLGVVRRRSDVAEQASVELWSFLVSGRLRQSSVAEQALAGLRFLSL